MKNKYKTIVSKILPIFFLILVAVAFYWKFFFKGLVPFPGDLLVGAYFPWLDYKWGNVVGVAVKNTFISDIFSAFYPWKTSFAQAFLNHEWPVWSPLLYSGYPLYANFNSGYLNPFNWLMVVFGHTDGWSLMVFAQPLFSMISMYIFLMLLGRKKYSAVLGSIVYSLGGFAMTWSQYVNAGFVMIWLPLILGVIELIKKTGKLLYIFAVTPLFLLVVTAGHFQGLVYTAIISVAYFVFRIGLKNKRILILFAISSLLAIGASCIQLIPTIELMSQSVRFDDGMIAGENYGLLPKQNLMTMVAPDYFGNPSTGNFWGFYNYHETIAYLSIIGLLGLLYGIFYFKKLSVEKFFVVSTLTGLLFQFDTPIGRAIYTFKVPFLSTCAAGRIGIVVLFGVAVLTAIMVEKIQELNFRDVFKIFCLPVLFVLLGAIVPFLANKLYLSSSVSSFLTVQIADNTVALRNLVIPTGIVLVLLGVFLVSKKFGIVKYLILPLVLLDLFRFGWKYLPFVPETYVFPPTEVTDFIKKDKTIFRVDKERGEVLPPNTWMGYDLMSPSGFDPLAVTTYVQAYREDLNGYTGGGVSRYSEIDRVDAEALGKYNVKYLLAIKRNERYEVPGDRLSYKINQKDWKRVFETKSVAVLQNNKYQERVRIVDNAGNNARGAAEIVDYKNNKVIVKFTNGNGDKLLLADTYYPGWQATIDGHQTKIGDEIRPFRTVDIRGIRDGEIVFEFKPRSFYVGLWISAVSLGLWLIALMWQILKKTKD